MNSKVDIFAIIESAESLKQLRELDVRPEWLKGIIFGAADFAASVGLHPTQSDFFFVKAQISIESARLGLISIDSPCFHLGNTDHLISQALQAKSIGFSGKIAIHPTQIGPINDSFSVTESELVEALKYIEAANTTSESPIGVVDGVMTGPPFEKFARNLLKNKSD